MLTAEAAFAQRQAAAWSSPPVDDVGYIPSAELLQRSDGELLGLAAAMRAARYGGWRNHGGRWRDLMGLDEMSGLDVIDFGCGTGIESCELARANQVTLADISPANLELAARMMRLHGHEPAGICEVWHTRPYLAGARSASFDVFYASGVLHHIPWARDIMVLAHGILRPGGAARLMLYSDEGWRIATGTEPPEDVRADPAFWRFVRHFDAVGAYADWYSAERLAQRFGDLFAVERCEYLTADRAYLGAVLRRLP